jgi:hypothetical protein
VIGFFNTYRQQYPVSRDVLRETASQFQNWARSQNWGAPILESPGDRRDKFLDVQYNFYINDERWGRMFVRMCPYLPFSARVCLNQHHWLAVRMRE